MRKGMSELEKMLYFKLGSMKRRVFKISDIVEILGVKNGHARKLAHKLVEKEIAIRVKPGTFIRLPESVILNKGEFGEDLILIASEMTEKYFISHYTALSIHGLADRFSNTVFVSSPTNQRSIDLKDGSIRFIRIKPERYFGTESKKYYEKQINVSDLERTIIDVVDRPLLSGGWIEVIQSLKNVESINEDRLSSHIIRLSNRKVARVLSFFLSEIENIDVSLDTIKHIKDYSGCNKYYIDKKISGSFDEKWDLIVPERIRKELHAD